MGLRAAADRVAFAARAIALLAFERVETAVGLEPFGPAKHLAQCLDIGREPSEAVRGELQVLAYEQCLRETPIPAVIQHIAATRA